MAEIRKLFLDFINNKQRYVGAMDGNEMDDRVESFLKNSLHISKFVKEDFKSHKYYNLIKKHNNDKFVENVLELPDDELSGQYVCQPFGTQSPPDFLIFERNLVYFLDTKRTDTDRPMWNAGYPRAPWLYVFCSTKTDAGSLTFAWGSDLMPMENRRVLEEGREALKRMRNLVKKENFPFVLYSRFAVTHMEKMMGHCDQEKREQRVLDALK